MICERINDRSIIEDELRDLRAALDAADDGNQVTRLRMMIDSRRAQLADMKRRQRN
jgi:hypothetical protein